jgi:hypothetical protein
MTRIGILKPRGPEEFTYADVFRAKLIDALLKAGFTRKQVQWATESGGLNLDSVDDPREEGRSYERAGHGHDQRFMCPPRWLAYVARCESARQAIDRRL